MRIYVLPVLLSYTQQADRQTDRQTDRNTLMNA